MTALPHESRGHLRAVPDEHDTPAGRDDLKSVTRFEWERWIRRVDVAPAVRLLAFTLSTYAGPRGNDIRPTNERLGRVLRCSTRTVQRNRQQLIDMGLLELLVPGRRGRAPVYRLTVPSDIPFWTDLLSPDEE